MDKIWPWLLIGAKIFDPLAAFAIRVLIRFTTRYKGRSGSQEDSSEMEER